MARASEATSIIRISLLGPRVAAIVIAARLPKSRLVGGLELDGAEPFRALPKVEMRHDQAHRAAVFLGERLSFPAMGEQRVLDGEVGERQVGGVAIVRMQLATSRPVRCAP